jgi:DNA-binding beta-propeller fold protein YncE
VSTLAGSGAEAQFCNPEGVAVDSSGNVYVADSGNHRIRKITVGEGDTVKARNEIGVVE